MGKVMIKILQRSEVTQTVGGGLTIHFPLANFLYVVHMPNIMKVGYQ